jgi:anti-anti-sigma factor
MNTIQAVVPAGKKTGHEAVVTLDLEGELGLTEMEEVLELLSSLSAQGVRGVVLDFEGVTHFHYRAARSLLAQAEQFREEGKDIKLCNLSAYLKAIFRSVGAHEAFDFHADASEARWAFHSMGAVFS